MAGAGDPDPTVGGALHRPSRGDVIDSDEDPLAQRPDLFR
jgi:hypothetical protein